MTKYMHWCLWCSCAWQNNILYSRHHLLTQWLELHFNFILSYLCIRDQRKTHFHYVNFYIPSYRGLSQCNVSTWNPWCQQGLHLVFCQWAAWRSNILRYILVHCIRCKLNRDSYHHTFNPTHYSNATRKRTMFTLNTSANVQKYGNNQWHTTSEGHSS